jgi:hypothetical protein
MLEVSQGRADAIAMLIFFARILTYRPLFFSIPETAFLASWKDRVTTAAHPDVPTVQSHVAMALRAESPAIAWHRLLLGFTRSGGGGPRSGDSSMPEK